MWCLAREYFQEEEAMKCARCVDRSSKMRTEDRSLDFATQKSLVTLFRDVHSVIEA